jgi:hypothetical protein
VFHISHTLNAHLLSHSTPVGLQFEKFIVPDNIRVLDAVLETLAF